MSVLDQIALADRGLDAPPGDSLAGGGKRRFSLNRKLSATDGPFAETKEGLGGSMLVDARDQDAVIDAVSKIPLPWLATPRSGSTERGSARHAVRAYQTTCAACGLPLAAGGSVLFQGDHLVHATCWRVDPRPLHDAPGVTLVGSKALPPNGGQCP
jgi:hypothetical protein